MMNWSSVIVLITLNVVFNQFVAGTPSPQWLYGGSPSSPGNGLQVNQYPPNSYISQSPYGSLMSPMAGDTGFRSFSDGMAGMFSNVGSSIGNAVNILFSETFGAVGGLIDNWFGQGVINRGKTPTYLSQLIPQSQPQAQSGAQTTPSPSAGTATTAATTAAPSGETATTQAPTTTAPTTQAPTTTAKPA